MEYKKCHKCGRTLPRTDKFFYKDKWTHATDGLKYTCRECEETRRRLKRPPPKWENPLKWCYCCKQELPRTNEYFYPSPDRIDELSSLCKKCNIIKRDEWQKENPEKSKEYRKKTVRNQWNNNVNFRLAVRLRNRVNLALRIGGGKKNSPLATLLGCSIAELKTYLEGKFLEGMRWENHGKGVDKWHIDHIKPCASFDLTKEEQQRECFNFKKKIARNHTHRLRGCDELHY